MKPTAKFPAMTRALAIFGGFLAIFMGMSFARFQPKTIINPTLPELHVDSMAYTDFETTYVPFTDLYNELVTPSLQVTYVIEEAVDLYYFSIAASGDDKESYLSLNYILGKNIDYSDASRLGLFFRPIGFLPHPNPDVQLTPLENEAVNPYAFQGSFDGQGFEITNLLIQPISLDDYTEVFSSALIYYSMFSVVGEEGDIHHLGLVNPILVQPINYGIMSKSSPLVGANHGDLNHVYVIDNRSGSEAGLNVTGNFHLSGLVVDNYGSIVDAFFAGARVKSTAVGNNNTTSLVAKTNSGTMTRVYYDSTIYLDTPSQTELGTALTTAAFQTSTNFSSQWFFNSSYASGYIPGNTYPVLLGFQRSGTTMFLNRASDFVYMTQMIDTALNFRLTTYQLRRDIDMSSLSRTAYKPPTTAFSGILESQTISTNPTGVLYTREVGDNSYFTILNLHLETGIDLGVYAGYGLFGILIGQVRNINFALTTLSVKQPELFTSEDYVAAGVIAARLQAGTINNVLLHASLVIPDTTLPRVYLGGLIGFGNGTIIAGQTHGTLDAGTHEFAALSVDSAFGGIAGFAGVPNVTTLNLIVQTSINYMTITGPTFETGGVGSQSLVGGLVGSGYMNRFTTVENRGDLISHDPATGYIDAIYMGGMIGYQLHCGATTSVITNYGDLYVHVNQPMKVRMAAGYGSGATTVSTATRSYTDLVNYGESNVVIPGGASFTETQLAAMDIQVAGIINGYLMSNSNFERMWNYASFEMDLSFVSAYAGVAIFNNSYYTIATSPDFRLRYDNIGNNAGGANGLTRVYQSGVLNATTSRPIYRHQIKIAGVSLGRNINAFLVRNTGNIAIDIDHDAPYELTTAPSTDVITNQQKNIIVAGVMEEISSSRRGENIYNGGHVTMTTNPAADIKFHVNLSGITHRNRNTSTTIISRQILNDGYVTFDGAVKGNVRVSGIVTFNMGTIQSSINAGDLYAKNAIQENTSGNADQDFLIDVGGIAALNPTSSTSAILSNAINYGDVVAYSTTAHGRVAAGGIIARNNRREDIAIPVNTTADRYYGAILRHAINYGDIYSWNERPESADTMAEVYSVSGGLVGVGILRIETSINYGGVYSKSVSGGIVGHLDMFAFARYTSISGTIIANLIHYGEARRMLSASAFSFSLSEGVAKNTGQIAASTAATGNQGFGAIFGDIYVGANNWNFSTGNYAFTTATKRYWLSFDDTADLIGQTPTVTVVNNTLANALSDLVMTTKLSDATVYPYANVRSYSLDDAPIGSDDGLNGTTYSGVFAATFPFMTPVTTTPAIANFIKLIPTNRVNSHLLSKIGLNFDPNDPTKGLFALGPTTGIGEEGLYLPDNWVFDSLNPHNGTADWRDEIVSGGESLTTKINYGMKQLSLSLATNIDNLQLVDVLGAPTIRLTNPVIDLDEYLITFYVSHNSAAAADGNLSSQATNAYVPAGAGYESFGAQFVGGVWIGPYSWNGSSYVADANGTHVQVPVTIYSSPSPKQFYVNTSEPATYILGYRASFFYESGNPSTSINLPSTILNSIGPYDANGLIRGSTNNILDDATTHYGTIRVYAEAYVYDPLDPEADPFTFKDYKIRIIRIAEQELTQVNSLTIDGVAAMPPAPIDVEDVDVTATPLYFKPIGNQGRMIIQYQTVNVSFGSTPNTNARLFDSNNTLLTATNRYTLTTVNAQTQLGYQPVTGTWVAGTLTYTFTINEALAAGNYTLELTIGTNQVYLIRFSKTGNTDALITSMLSTGYTITNTGNTYTSDLPFGMYYNPLDASTTRTLNFTNIPTLINIPAAQTNTTTFRPNYLTTFTISPYSTLVSATVAVNPERIDGYRYQYIVTYVVQAELGAIETYTHVMTERAVVPTPTAAYKGVNPFTESIYDVEFAREEAPTYLYEYPLTALYRYGTHTQAVDVVYSGGGTPVNGVEYTTSLSSTGMTIAFGETAPIGIYEVSLVYQETYTYTNASYPLYGLVQEWDLEYQAPTFRKVGNTNSRLINIAFTSDSIYAGLNVILHPTIMDEELYVDLLLDPTLREIILLPITGIEYNQHIDKQSYYIIGQVSETNLVYYAPTFVAPVGANIVRMNNDGTPADELYADFSPMEDGGFVYIWYRIYAEDYIEGHEEYGTHYTDYRIAVQDVSRSVYLTVQVYADLDVPFDWAYVSFRLVQDGLPTMSISFYTYFDGINMRGANAPLVNTSGGTFHVYINLPTGYTFTIEVNTHLTEDPNFLIPFSVVPKRYTVRITIVEVEEQTNWGQNLIEFFTPQE
jgi:hypothetical protein